MQESPDGATNAEIFTCVEEDSQPETVVVFMDGSVKRGVKPGWVYSARQGVVVVVGGSDTFARTTSIMCI